MKTPASGHGKIAPSAKNKSQSDSTQLFQKIADNLYVSQAIKPCGDPKALEVSHALKNDFDIVEPDNASCDEVWDKAFQVMDSYEGVEQEQENAKHYHLRQTIEQATGRTIPWILQASAFDPSKQGDAIEIRKKVYNTIHKLKEILKNANGEVDQRRLIIGLYWFVLTLKKNPPPPGTQGPGGIDLPTSAAESLETNHLNGFSSYLKINGGLGISEIKKDADLEATALEAIIQKKGWCTEQAKILYAVLRMAGIEAFFVEPQLPIEYFARRGELENLDIPLPGHMATGVGVKVRDKMGKERTWILDTAMKMLEADYTEYDSWTLSLRQFLMADLSNLGSNQKKLGQMEAAKKSYEMALRLGRDRPVNDAAENYYVLLSPPFNLQPTMESGIQLACDSVKSCADLAYQLNPMDPLAVYNYAFEMEKKSWVLAGKLYLQTIELDPRYENAYKEIIWLLSTLKEKESKLYWGQFKSTLKKILKKRDKNGESLFQKSLNRTFINVLSDLEWKEKINPLVLRRVKHLIKELGIDKEN